MAAEEKVEKDVETKVDTEIETKSTESEDSYSELLEDPKPGSKAKAKAEPEDKGKGEKVERSKTADKVEDVKTEEVKTEPEDKTKEEPTSPAEQGQLAAMLAERDKRKKAEDALEKLKAEHAEPVKVPDPIEDPEGYSEFVRGQASNDGLKLKINLSRDVVKTLEPDFDKLEKVFKDMVADEDGNVIDEGLLRRYQLSDNPAKFSMDEARKKIRSDELGDPKFEENLKAKLRVELLAEIEKEGIKAVELPDLTTASSAGKNSEERVEPDSWGEIIE